VVAFIQVICYYNVDTVECLDGRTVEICDMKIPKEPYMILEAVNSLNDKNFQSTYIILLNKKTVLKIVIIRIMYRDKDVIMRLNLRIALYLSLTLNLRLSIIEFILLIIILNLVVIFC